MIHDVSLHTPVVPVLFGEVSCNILIAHGAFAIHQQATELQRIVDHRSEQLPNPLISQ